MLNFFFDFFLSNFQLKFSYQSHYPGDLFPIFSSKHRFNSASASRVKIRNRKSEIHVYINLKPVSTRVSFFSYKNFDSLFNEV